MRRSFENCDRLIQLGDSPETASGHSGNWLDEEGSWELGVRGWGRRELGVRS
uniref:Uncharacterized protein n=1 Tax=Desertifilum tharense IPPAS B-1220 TaxID=1781255 RepID=A0ACD5GNY1_9CYAN